ncbi:MAG: glycosyltransferase family 2 protein, partial [Micrococcales bacterium]|nr:glycosyltransferase family 2 protein [Micrococcales bacterium]
MSIPHLVVIAPAFNEADGIADFIAEIYREVSPRAAVVEIVVIDDASTDDTAAKVIALGLDGVRVVVQPHNRGHGPAAIAAYREGLARGADVIVHVDGDGQFDGADIARVALSSKHHEVVHGIRRGRTDPWYRRVLSTGLRLLIWPFARRRIPDINTPLRAYHPDALR